jgi:hypothetical protein
MPPPAVQATFVPLYRSAPKTREESLAAQRAHNNWYTIMIATMNEFRVQNSETSSEEGFRRSFLHALSDTCVPAGIDKYKCIMEGCSQASKESCPTLHVSRTDSYVCAVCFVNLAICDFAVKSTAPKKRKPDMSSLVELHKTMPVKVQRMDVNPHAYDDIDELIDSGIVEQQETPSTYASTGSE